jgi:2-iminobutanoate/2-iminopropanoate deaminase
MSGSASVAGREVTPLTIAGVPAPAGHYSHAVRCGELVFISGQLPAPGPDGRVAGDFETQAREALGRVLAIAGAAGGGPASLAKVTAYVVGVDHWPVFNRVCAELLGEARPARCVVPAPELHYGALVEVEAVASISRPDGVDAPMETQHGQA